jgi:simple sugar transport system permease protein
MTDQKAASDRPSRKRRRGIGATIGVPLGAVLLAILVGSILIVISGLVGPRQTFDLTLPLVAFESLFEGATGISFIDLNDSGAWSFAASVDLARTQTALIDTATKATPLVLTGLAVGVGFKAGLFNIGGTGQLLAGGFLAALAGAALAQQPVFVAFPLAMLAAAVGGAVLGLIPGLLKAYRGAHEVVTTIMLNSLVVFVASGLVNDIFSSPEFSFARTAEVGNAHLPALFGNLHVGVLIALLVVPLAYWLIWRTTLGFEIRTVGANPWAARYAGMSPRRMIILTMTLCGVLAGLAGGIEILNLGFYPAIYGTTYGFDGITVALLGRAHPVGILLSAILFGFMRAGAPLMQIQADIPVEIVDVIQALILLFLAAEIVVRRVFRIRAAETGLDELQTVTRSYGEATT